MTEILKIILPALLVLITAYFLLHKLLRNENERRKFELKTKLAPETIKIRLQAYERFALLLERTNPATLILRVIAPGMNSLELQKELLQQIRTEFSHNISQQIYISDELWSALKAVQENLLKLVNISAEEIEKDAPATELAEKIIGVYNANSENPTIIALGMLKKEVREIL